MEGAFQGRVAFVSEFQMLGFGHRLIADVQGVEKFLRMEGCRVDVHLVGIEAMVIQERIDQLKQVIGGTLHVCQVEAMPGFLCDAFQ